MQGFLHNAFKKVQGFLYSCLAYFSFQKTSWGFTFLLSNNSSHLFGKKSSHLGVFCKKVFLKISQKFKTNTCDGVSFFIKRGIQHTGFPVNFVNFFYYYNTFFYYRTPSVVASEKSKSNSKVLNDSKSKYFSLCTGKR